MSVTAARLHVTVIVTVTVTETRLHVTCNCKVHVTTAKLHDGRAATAVPVTLWHWHTHPRTTDSQTPTHAQTATGRYLVQFRSERRVHASQLLLLNWEEVLKRELDTHLRRWGEAISERVWMRAR